jgi:ABC-type ATPase with predicted acetyltransferase domain
MEYTDCEVLCTLKRKIEPLVTKVLTDEFTDMVNECFDFDFNGESKFYPYELPNEILNMDFDILCIVGGSGKGKSTLLKEFDNQYHYANKDFDETKAIVSNFNTPDEASRKLSAVGLNSLPVWCRPRNVLSIGEGFRADVALNLESYTIFDEFTSTIDRNVAKSTSNGLQKYIRKNGLNHMVFCSCHKDYIPFLKPNIVIDLDEEKVYDCGDGVCLGKTSLSKCTNPQTKTFGEFLGSITI